MPASEGIADERQQGFIHRVQGDPALHDHAEVIEGNLSQLKKDLIRRLEPPQTRAGPPAAVTKAACETPKLYLICDAKDEANIEELEDYLFEQGLEVLLPAFDGNDEDAAALHQENLLSCDAVLVYYGDVPKAWVDIKLRELLKAAGYGREAPIAEQAVYVAPPDDRRKERYRSHQAIVIHQGQDFAPSSALHEFVGRIKEVYE
jgi:hypothetical protein